MKLYDLCAENCLIYEDKAVFVAKQLNMIYMLDLTTREVKIVGSIPGEDFFGERLIGDIKYWNNQVIFVPLNAKKIWIYCLECSEWQGVTFEQNLSPDCNYKFMGSYLYEDQLYMFGFGYPGIGILNLNDHSIKFIDVTVGENEQLKTASDGCFWGMNYVIKDSKIYLASLRSNMVMKFNVETLKKEWISVGSSSNRYIGMDWDGQYFWLAPRTNGNIVKWDGENFVEEFPLPNGYGNNRYYFHGVCADDTKITLHSFAGKTLEVFSKETCKMKVLEEKILLHKKINDMKTIKICDGVFEIYDCIQKMQNKYECKINNLQFGEFVSANWDIYCAIMSNSVTENNMIDLELLLKILKQKSNKAETIDKKPKGWNIYNRILETT